MADSRRKLGKWGESVAAIHLEAKGYRIIERNWRCPSGEIDIVAEHGPEMVFVEVKTRWGSSMGSPEEALTKVKAEKIRALAQHYLSDNSLDPDWRIDLVAVELDERGKFIRCDHLENAVLGW